jgi:two-component system, chemotaxis family, response regulator PixG
MPGKESLMSNLLADMGMIQLLDQLSINKQEGFTGKLSLKDDQGRAWILYLFMGRLFYGNGGQCPVRRWQRQITKVNPKLHPAMLGQIIQHKSSTAADWDYDLLLRMCDRKALTAEQLTATIRGILAEVFLELAQCKTLTVERTPGLSITARQVVLLDPANFAQEQEAKWQQAAQLAEYSLDKAIVLRQPERLRSITSEGAYQTLTQLVNSENTLWDLGVRLQRSPLDVLSSLLPHIQSRIMELVPIKDLPGPTPPTLVATPPAPASQLIACVDDSAWVGEVLGKLLTGAGYRFLSIQDPLRAIPTLLAQKPALILLDLRMPNTNGYEICEQLRRLSAFRTTPIIILTGNDGVIDRMRAKFVGATDFLSKSVDHQQVLLAIKKYLVADVDAAG